MGKQDTLLRLIKRLGGEIPLSELETRYQEEYGETLNLPKNVNLQTYMYGFDSIAIKTVSDGSNGRCYYAVHEKPKVVPPPYSKMSPTEESNILSLIIESGGEISLSILKEKYLKTFGVLLQQKKFRDWIGTSNHIGTRRSNFGNDYVAFDQRSAVDQYQFNFNPPPPPPPRAVPSPSSSIVDEMSTPEENNILKLVRKSSKHEVSLSNLRLVYEEAFGVALQCPKRELREWIERAGTIGTKKSGKNDLVAYERHIKSSTMRISDMNIIPEDDDVEAEVEAYTDEHKDDVDSNNEHFTTVGSERDANDNDEYQIDCDDIVEKLMGYAGGEFKPTIVHQDDTSLLNILPMEWSDALEDIGMEKVSDISLDLGRRPYCWYNHQRKYISQDPVEDRDIRGIMSSLQGFGDDNRSGIDGQLHRISGIRNNSNGVIGLTIRVGRHIEGNSDMIRDLLEETDKSILLLGEPGSGKTTIVRDVAKILSRESNVFIVDTSNEIAGDGNIPHICVGNSRRMMVKSLPSQADTMIECVQNHTPSVMIIDEIGRKREVEAAQTSKNRGVRMIASAHGDLRSLIKNKDIRGLIGGLETVTLGDAEAKEVQKKTGSKTLPKQQTTRAAAAIFEVIIELKRGRLNEWHIIPEADKAVDAILLQKKYDIQKRMRCMNSGSIFVEHIKN